MSTDLNQHVKGSLVLRYTDDRVKEMLKIKEKCCLPTQRMVIEQLKNYDMEIKKIHHADKPNGTIDIIFEFIGPKYNLLKLRDSVKHLQNLDVGIGGIGVLTPLEIS